MKRDTYALSVGVWRRVRRAWLRLVIPRAR